MDLSWIYHDEEPIAHATFDDLDPDRVQYFFTVAYGRKMNAEETLAYLQALRGLTRERVPTLTGILSFGRDPQHWLPDASITAVRMQGVDVGPVSADRQEIGGTLETQVEQALAFLKRHLAEPYRIEGGLRHELGIADEVRREALVNAVVHRDYRMTAPTRLIVFHDRVELTSPGGLLNSLTIERHQARPHAASQQPHLCRAGAGHAAREHRRRRQADDPHAAPAWSS
jgi:ATP-dependent DNA helicase RecG